MDNATAVCPVNCKYPYFKNVKGACICIVRLYAMMKNLEPLWMHSFMHSFRPNQIFRAALFAVAHSKEFQALLKPYQRVTSLLPPLYGRFNRRFLAGTII
jgi:hypothetical protein